ncbi:hypothetical protein PF007_g7276 [Phytophthora fragariae]|uniref:Uncharacterized protein n=1 Tax=Phytophthora fragariae TaxID=53985 RepID=A0A6A3LIQ9_9STRA|nr:hypothetical protein PF011_g5903 [Phytophthora fragariae]KAE9122850.1 hypothetical protein PF007_g7276 [Phytophthora fragariae]
MASWQFLQPWALALNRVLVHLEQLSDESAKTLVEIECFPENFDYTAFGFPKTVIQESYVLLLAIPADAATRGDRQHLQRVREAIDLFQVLALVNSAAFADLIFDFYDGVSGPNCVIRLEWRLFLIGSIAPDDPAATKPTVTWGELLGFPGNPWDISSDFCDAMRRVKDMARPTSGEEVGLSNNIFWYVTCDGISVRGEQDPPQDKRYTSLLEFSRRVGNCIEMEAPPVVQVGVVGDGSELVVAAWGQDAKVTQLENAILECAIYSAPVIAQVTAALARCDINELTIGLGDAAADDQPNVLGIAGAGYLFSTILCKNPPLYRLQNPNQELVRFFSRRTKLDHVTVIYESGSTMRFGGIYSALAEAPPVQEIVVEYDSERAEDRYNLPPSQTHWVWLAYAFWSKTSHFSAQILRISYISLTENDVAAVRRVLENSYPQPARQRDRTQAPKYGFISAQGRQRDSASEKTQVTPFCCSRGDAGAARSMTQVKASLKLML